jgi:hypothetical protein
MASTKAPRARPASAPQTSLLLLILALLALAPLTPLASPALVKASPEKATIAEARGSLYLYRDGSASLALRIVEKLEQPTAVKYSLNASLDVDELAHTITASLSYLAKPLAIPSGQVPSDFKSFFELSYEKALRAELGNITSMSLELRAWNRTSETSLSFSLSVVDKRAVGPVALWEGSLKLVATGEFAKFLREYVEENNTVNEERLKGLVSSLFNAPITGWGSAVARVDLLKASKAENELRIDFRVLIDKGVVDEQLSKLFPASAVAAYATPSFDEVFSPPSTHPITLSLTSSQDAFHCRIEGDLKAHYENLWKAFTFAYVVHDIFGRHITAPSPYAINVWQLLLALGGLAKDFRVVGDGKLCFSLREAEGAEAESVTLRASLLSIELATPKVMKRGSQSSMPVDTLKALSNYTLTLYNTLFYWVKEPDVSNITLDVFSEEGVKVKLGGAEVKEVAFKDVSSLKVTLATALTVSAEPSTVDAGGEVVVKGRIEPAMSVPITISVAAPDGSLKTIDVTAGEDGSFSVPVRLEGTGSYTITASYAGGELYEPSTASAVVEVRAPPAPPAPLTPSAIPEALWYVIAVVVVVVGIIIAVLKAPRGARRP